MNKLTILDVGHGNCAVLHDDRGTVVIDGGMGRTLVQYLKGRRIAEVDTVIISHADSDHLGGIIDLLSEKAIKINRIYLNRDSLKKTKTWKDARIVLHERDTAGTRIDAQLTTVCSEELLRGETRLEVLSPTPMMALAGVGDQDFDTATLTSNSMSAVIKVATTNSQDVLLAADMTSKILDKLLSNNVDLKARVLVFPHHGGLSAGHNTADFAKRLCEAVQPELIIFSIGRGQFQNPQPEIVAGVKQAVPNAHIACTQLSRHCSAAGTQNRPNHLAGSHGDGLLENHCCAGTFYIQLGTSALECLPTLTSHTAFIELSVATPLCRQVKQKA